MNAGQQMIQEVRTGEPIFWFRGFGSPILPTGTWIAAERLYTSQML
jgi:hypothetical protein